MGHGTLAAAPGVNHETLAAKGFTPEKIAAVEKAVASAFDIKFVFNKWTLGEDFLTGTLGLSPERIDQPDFDLLAEIGFGKREIEAANEFACGAMTLEGAPGLNPDHLPVFDCASPLRAQGQAVPVGREPYPHDGGGAAVHLRRHLQDHQHAERRDPSKTARRPISSPGGWR